jgi:solute carrier family 8 (sodium/calcium exchanger)
MIPGFQLSAIWVQGVAYLLILFYLFLGIALVADIFMESIETITSKTTLVTIPSAEGNIVIEKPVWNPTIANLTLMALGSSAPEIILSVSEVAKDIEAVPGMLGPMTIVGSASFNLMVISAVSIMAVTEVKKIYDLNVFFITVVSSTWAYVWYFLVLSVITPDEVTLLEAFLTVGYMVILLIFAYSADRCTARSTDAKEEEENNKKLAMKARLRLLGKKYGMKAIVECCYEQKPDGGVRVKANDAADIQEYFRRLLDVQDLHAVPLDEIIDCMNPENPVERIAYRRQVAAAAPKSFVKVKGGAKDEALTGEAAIIHENNENMNADIGFKHAKYEVAEGNQVVNVTIVKKCKEDFTVRVRTVDVQALAPKDYEAKDEYITIKHHETERIIQIKIVNDAEWEPDKDFKVELLGDDGLRLAGNDSECVVTIIDDEKPGVLGFEDRFVNIKRSKAMATLKILRTQGSDGVVECRVFTAEPDNADVIEGEPAVVNEDFKELDEQVVFEAGVVERTVQIQLPECTDMGEMIKSFRV